MGWAPQLQSTGSGKVRVWHHGMEVGVGGLYERGWFPGEGCGPDHQQMGRLDKGLQEAQRLHRRVRFR